MKHSKNKIILGLFIVASVVILAIGLLIQTVSNTGSISSKNSPSNTSELSDAKVENTQSKDVTHFSVFSILNRLIPN